MDKRIVILKGKRYGVFFDEAGEIVGIRSENNPNKHPYLIPGSKTYAAVKAAVSA